jgi:acetoin utilization protein AcuB
MNVGHYMQPDPVTARADTPLEQIRQVMEDTGFSLLLIVDEDKTLVGFMTRAALKGVTDWTVPVREACFDARFAVAPEDTLEKAALILLNNQLVLLPVVSDGRLVGVVSQSEILRALARALGIGLEGTRITVRVPRDAKDDAPYSLLAALRDRNVQLVSLAQGRRTETYHELILRVQGLEDRDGLRTDLEAILRNHADTDAVHSSQHASED